MRTAGVRTKRGLALTALAAMDRSYKTFAAITVAERRMPLQGHAMTAECAGTAALLVDPLADVKGTVAWTL
jgi:hypothetical protein